MQTLRYKRLVLLPALAAALAAGCGGNDVDEPTSKQREAQQEIEATTGHDLSTPEKIIDVIKETEPEAYAEFAQSLDESEGTDLRDPTVYGIMLEEFEGAMGAEAVELYDSMGITPAEILDAGLDEEGY